MSFSSGSVRRTAIVRHGVAAVTIGFLIGITVHGAHAMPTTCPMDYEETGASVEISYTPLSQRGGYNTYQTRTPSGLYGTLGGNADGAACDTAEAAITARDSFPQDPLSYYTVAAAEASVAKGLMRGYVYGDGVSIARVQDKLSFAIDPAVAGDGPLVGHLRGHLDGVMTKHHQDGFVGAGLIAEVDTGQGGEPLSDAVEVGLTTGETGSGVYREDSFDLEFYIVEGAIYSILSRLVVTADSGLADFTHTALFDLILPDGVSFTSDTGWFMTESPYGGPISTPEPATFGLLGAGLFGLGLLARRSRRRSGIHQTLA